MNNWALKMLKQLWILGYPQSDLQRCDQTVWTWRLIWVLAHMQLCRKCCASSSFVNFLFHCYFVHFSCVYPWHRSMIRSEVSIGIMWIGHLAPSMELKQTYWSQYHSASNPVTPWREMECSSYYPGRNELIPVIYERHCKKKAFGSISWISLSVCLSKAVSSSLAEVSFLTVSLPNFRWHLSSINILQKPIIIAYGSERVEPTTYMSE